MRLKTVFAVAAAGVALGLASPDPASAFDRDRPDIPQGWHGEQTVRHWVYYPRYRHYYLTNGQADPFGYDYRPRGYYPYYNSGYWKPAGDVELRRAAFVRPTYYPAWGAERTHRHHAKWHKDHHRTHDHLK